MNSGSLVKLYIEAYTRVEFDQDSGTPSGRFEVMFNPEKYTRKYEVEYEQNKFAWNVGLNSL